MNRDQQMAPWEGRQNKPPSSPPPPISIVTILLPHHSSSTDKSSCLPSTPPSMHFPHMHHLFLFLSKVWCWPFCFPFTITWSLSLWYESLALFPFTVKCTSLVYPQGIGWMSNHFILAVSQRWFLWSWQRWWINFSALERNMWAISFWLIYASSTKWMPTLRSGFGLSSSARYRVGKSTWFRVIIGNNFAHTLRLYSSKSFLSNKFNILISICQCLLS